MQNILTELAINLMSIESVTPNCEKALNYLTTYLKNLGFATERLVFGSTQYPKDDYKVDNLFAIYNPELKKGKHLCFAGHIDVVPTGDLKLWTCCPFKPKIVEGKLFGRGACDMKAAIAAFICAFKELQAKNLLSKEHSISLLITGDEEQIGLNGTNKVLEYLKMQDIAIDFCLVGEPTGMNKSGDQIKIGRRGSLNGQIIVQGKQSHSAYHKDTLNPIPMALNIMQGLLNLKLDKPSIKLNIDSKLQIVGVKSSTQITNIIPANVEILFNIRFNDNYTPEILQKMIEGVTEHHKDAVNLSIETPISLPFLGCPEPTYLNLVAASCSESNNGIPPLKTATGGTSDARFITNYAPCIELGLPNNSAHQIDEYLVIDELIRLKEIYKNIILKWFLST